MTLSAAVGAPQRSELDGAQDPQATQGGER